MKQVLRVLLVLLVLQVLVLQVLVLQVPVLAAPVLLDESIPPGANFDKAEFRLWIPDGAAAVKALIVLVPGSNGDGRPQAEDPVWQDFAKRNNLAIVACRFTDKPHDQGFIEEYVNVSKGSGQALLDVITTFAKKSNHPEIANAPMLMWGMSAGGQVDYEFAAWKPERVVAYIVNKGGIYYSALVQNATRQVPALLFTGDKDLAFRVNTINGLFAVNRRGGALWALVNEPDTAHAVGRSRDLGIMFFEDVMAIRLSGGVLKPMPEKSGFIADLTAHTYQAVADAPAPTVPTAWLPTERIAKAWQAVVTGKPF